MPKIHFFVFLKTSSFPRKSAKYVVSARERWQQTGLKAYIYMFFGFISYFSQVMCFLEEVCCEEMKKGWCQVHKKRREYVPLPRKEVDAKLQTYKTSSLSSSQPCIPSVSTQCNYSGIENAYEFNSYRLEVCICICAANPIDSPSMMYLCCGGNQNTTCRWTPIQTEAINLKQFPICICICIYKAIHARMCFICL